MSKHQETHAAPRLADPTPSAPSPMVHPRVLACLNTLVRHPTVDPSVVSTASVPPNWPASIKNAMTPALDLVELMPFVKSRDISPRALVSKDSLAIPLLSVQ